MWIAVENTSVTRRPPRPGRSVRRHGQRLPPPLRPGVRPRLTRPDGRLGPVTCGARVAHQLVGAQRHPAGAARQPDRHRPQRRRPGDVDGDEPGRDAAPVLQVADGRPGRRRRCTTRRSGRRAPRGRGPAGAGATAARPSAATAIHTTMPCTRVTVVIARSKRRACSSPACGPVPVTTVPATSASPVQTHDPAHRADGCAAPRRRSAGHRRARRRGPRARPRRPTSTIDSRKWLCTATGWRWTSTVIPPRTIWPITPADQSERQPRQVASARPADERAEHGEDHDDRDEAGEQPVDLLDRRVRGADVDELVVVAARPVVAPEPGAGEPHGGAGDDDDAQQGQRDDGDPAVLGRADALVADAPHHSTNPLHGGPG